MPRQNILRLDNLVHEYKTQNIFVLPSILTTKITTESKMIPTLHAGKPQLLVFGCVKPREGLQHFAGSLPTLRSFNE